MHFRKSDYGSARPIKGYGNDSFRVGNEVFQGPVLVLPTGVLSWGGFSDSAPLCAVATEIDVLFVGTGAQTCHLPAALREILQKAGLNAEPMATPAACRSYNVLLDAGRRVGAALLPVGTPLLPVGAPG